MCDKTFLHVCLISLIQTLGLNRNEQSLLVIAIWELWSKHVLHVLFKLRRGLWSQRPISRQSVQIGGYALPECMFACWWDTLAEYVDQEYVGLVWSGVCGLVCWSVDQARCWQVSIAFHKFNFKVAMSAFKVVRISCSCQTSELLWKHVSTRQQLYESI